MGGAKSDWWSGYKFMEILKRLKTRILAWNKEIYGDVSDWKNEILHQIVQIDKVEEHGYISSQQKEG